MKLKSKKKIDKTNKGTVFVQQRFLDIPKTIKVFANVYQTKLFQSSTHCNHQGLCDTTEKLIQINTDFTEENIADTLIHEILHAIWYETNLRTEKTEEKIVHMVATGLTTVMIDNPSLVKWLHNEWDKYTYVTIKNRQLKKVKNKK